MNPNEPGQVIKPGEAVSPTPAEPPTPEVTTTPEAPQAPTPIVTAPLQSVPEQSPQPTESIPAPLPPQQPTASSDGLEVTWTASEYLANPKSAGWFSLLVLASIALAVAVYFVTKDIISTVIIGILGLIVGVFAARQPRVLEYRIDNHGLSIGQKFYPYGSFKSFSIAQEHAIHYISLLPLKRFMPPLTVHYDPADEDQIAGTLAEYLPYEDHKPDIVDNLSRRFRF